MVEWLIHIMHASRCDVYICTQDVRVAPDGIFARVIPKGTKEMSTAIPTNSSARRFPKSRKLKANGFVKSSKTVIGNRIGVGP